MSQMRKTEKGIRIQISSWRNPTKLQRRWWLHRCGELRCEWLR
ncbi:unnamed protein product [Arabidopsis halleri]